MDLDHIDSPHNATTTGLGEAVYKKVEAILAAPITGAKPSGTRFGDGWAKLVRGACVGCPKC